MPVKNLIVNPVPDSIYLNLYKKYLPVMHKSKWTIELTPAIVKWIDTLALQTQVTLKQSDLDWTHGYFLYQILFEYSVSKKSKLIEVFESGTAKGFSAIIIVKAILDAKKNPRVNSFDIISHDDARFWNSIGDLKGKRSRRELLKDYSEFASHIKFWKLRTNKLTKFHLQNIKIDCAFLDGAHTFSDLKKEFNFIVSKLNNKGIIIFDDYDVDMYPGVVKFVKTIPKNITIVKDVGFKSFAIYTNN